VNDLLSGLLKNVAPGLATAVVGPLGGMAVKAIADKLGVENSTEAVTAAIQADPNTALKLAEIDTKQFELEVEDRKNAREMAMLAIQSEDPFVRRFTYYFIGSWSIFAMTIIPFIIFGNIPEDNVRFADTIIGFLLGTVVASMFSFLLGSSFGSRQKDKK
jgi:hypothetical protein